MIHYSDALRFILPRNLQVIEYTRKLLSRLLYGFERSGVTGCAQLVRGAVLLGGHQDVRPGERTQATQELVPSL